LRTIRQRGGDAADAEAVLLVWDADNQACARAAGLEQSLATVDQSSLRWVLGMPMPLREAWILAGFEPQNDAERASLGRLRSMLGYSPCDQPERLTSTDASSPRHPKRVLAALTGDVVDRERWCLRIGSDARWQRLTTVGTGCGLSVFLLKIESALVPCFDVQRG